MAHNSLRKIQLDPSKLLGFVSLSTSAKVGSKIGGKLGSKVGNKAGKKMVSNGGSAAV